MVTEFERRFLVPDASNIVSGRGSIIVQGYLHIKNGWCVRVRRRHEPSPEGGYAEAIPTLSLKGPRQYGERTEYEKSIDIASAEVLLQHTDWKIVKTRHQVVDAGQTFDVDVFHHPSNGLIIAEAESADGLPEFTPPEWCGAEITHDTSYNNELLAWSGSG